MELVTVRQATCSCNALELMEQWPVMSPAEDRATLVFLCGYAMHA